MRAGLHIGVGAWIDAQLGSSGGAAFPLTPIPFRLTHPAALETAADLARVAELSLIANRTDGGAASFATGGIPTYLWETHKRVISDMVHAISTLSAAERAELQRVNAILFGADGLSLSPAHSLYCETRDIYIDLVAANAPSVEVQAAYDDWLTIGRKSEIEAARARRLSLTQAMSNALATQDLAKIEMALMASGADIPFAPTVFTPISAVSTQHWREAEVDFGALEQAIGADVPRRDWDAFRARRRGSVRFRYVSIELHRSWFTTAVYEADDWRLEDGGSVATGDGRTGRLPAYVSHVHLARIIEIKIVAPQPQVPVVNPKPNVVQMTSVIRPTATSATRPTVLSAAVARPSSRGVTAVPRRPSAGTARAMLSSPRGVVARPSTAVLARPALSNRISGNARFSVLESKPHVKIGQPGQFAVMTKMSRVSAIEKLGFAQAVLASPRPTTTVTPGDQTTYIVALGRAKLPVCPNPNPAYQWP